MMNRSAHGQAEFAAIFPGWYAGRLTHLQGKIVLSGVPKDTTNFFFLKAGETAVYASSLYVAREQNTAAVQQGLELQSDTAVYQALTMTVAGDVSTGYVASYVLKYS